jgi:pilus assembly protein CpaF
VISMQEIYRFEQQGVDERGQTRGEFRATGVRPVALERITRYGIDPAEVLRSILAGE